MFKKRQERKAIALIMAVAIMAVLAVIGFGFASSMKLESAATNAIRNLAQARLAAYAAIQLCQGALIDDAEATPSQTAGPLADHFNESLYQHPVPAAQETLLETGYLTVKATAASLPYYGGSGAGTVKIRDASSKMNLNAFGNLSKWYPDAGDYPNSVSTVTNAAESVYHGVNQRFSSFEVSFEEFFFYLYMTGGLWNTSWPSAVQLTYDAGNPNDADSKEARLRCANLARAICLYRYGPDAKPGFAGTDDDQDNHLLTADDIDNDGDSQNNEANEGVDEPDEYVPAKPYGDDTKFNYIAEFKDAIKATYSIGPGVPAAVGYASDADAEAERIYAVVRTELTLDSYTLDIRSACIDHPGYDGYDNDGDGMVDENETEDADGARTLAGLKAQITAGKTIYGTYNPGTGTFTDRIDICERGLEDSNAGRAAQAVYLHRKLRKVVQRFTLKNALDIVDYRDTDHVPTFISKADVFVLTDGNLNEDLYGMEGLHVTEVGRYIDVGANQFGSEVVPWTGNAGTCTYTVLVEHDEETERTSTLSITDAASLKQGDYIIKFQVQLPANGNGKLIVKNADGSLEKEITQNGTAYFGPLNVDNSGKGSIRVFANYLQGKVLNDIVGQTFTISDFHILLPYVEVMNWSKKDIDMADLYV